MGNNVIRCGRGRCGKRFNVCDEDMTLRAVIVRLSKGITKGIKTVYGKHLLIDRLKLSYNFFVGFLEGCQRSMSEEQLS